MEIHGKVYFIKKIPHYGGDSLFLFLLGCILLGYSLSFFLYFLYDRSAWLVAFLTAFFSSLFLLLGLMSPKVYPYIFFEEKGFTSLERRFWEWIFKKDGGIPKLIQWDDVVHLSIMPGEQIDGFTGKRIKVTEITIRLKGGETLTLLSTYFEKEDFEEICQIFRKMYDKKRTESLQESCENEHS